MARLFQREGDFMTAKTLLLAAAAAALALAGCATTPAGAPSAPEAAAAKPDAALAAAIASPIRPADHKARDAARHPAESLAFWGLKPGMTVMEIQPGGEAWWTYILANYAAQTKGQYIAAHADLNNPKISDAARKSRADFEKQFADPAHFGKIQVVGFGPVSGPLGAPNSVDMILSARSVHGWIRASLTDKAMADFFAVLKPGGVLAIEQHRANASVTDTKTMMDTGYVSEAYVIAAAEKAGFKLAERSEINANPKDTKDHPFGVWTLPPTKRTAPFGQPDNPAFDRTKYDAIGESDRMTLKFVKPKA
jgi:predicted methyltransferase